MSSLKRENQEYKVGNPVDVTNNKNKLTGRAEWSGYARLDRAEWWIENGDAVPVTVHCEEFTENGKTFSVPGGKIAALGLRKDVVVNGKVIGRAKSIKILSRSAATKLEKDTHNRWPVVGHPDGGGLYSWDNE